MKGFFNFALNSNRMKKIATPFLFLAFCLNARAQQLPNAGFENWDIISGNQKDRATSWNTINATVSSSIALFLSQTCFRESTPAKVKSGTYSIHLKTVPPPLSGYPTVNGLATTGKININTYAVDGGLAYILRPDSLVGYYMCNPQPGDFSTVEFVLKGALADTIGWARFQTPSSAVTSYQRFSVPVVYRNGNTPDTAVALLSSSNGHNAVAGSELWVDDLQLIFNNNSVQQNAAPVASVTLVNENLIVKSNENTENASLQLLDMTGREILKQALSGNETSISVAGMPQGVYIYRITQQGQITKTGKVQVR